MTLEGNELCKKAFTICVNAHLNQVGKDGMLYVYHPIRLANKFSDIRYQVVALLHDVIEDSHYTVESLVFEGIPRDLAETVEILSKREEDDYLQFIKNIKASGNEIAIAVKLMDLCDNLNVARFKEINDSSHKKIKLYVKAVQILRGCVDPLWVKQFV